jgi:hypothetical protein
MELRLRVIQNKKHGDNADQASILETSPASPSPSSPSTAASAAGDRASLEAGSRASEAAASVSRSGSGSRPVRANRLVPQSVAPCSRSRAADNPVGSVQAEINPRLLLGVGLGRVGVPGLDVQDVLLEVVGHAAVGGDRGVDWVGAPHGGSSCSLLVRWNLTALADPHHSTTWPK